MGSSLSNSKLGRLLECRRCFWLENFCLTCNGPSTPYSCKRASHNVWKRPSGPFPGIPNGIDDKLRIHYNNFRKINKLPPELSNRPECADLKLFPDESKVKEWGNPFNYNIGLRHKDTSLDSVLKGGLDELLITDEGKLVVLDFKTMRSKPKDIDKDPEMARNKLYNKDIEYGYQRQLSIYTFLLQKLGKETEDYGLLLHYYPDNVKTNGDFEFGTELIKMPISIDDAYNIWKDGATLLKSPCPPDNGDCVWCKGRP